MGEKRYESAQTSLLCRCISLCWELREILASMKSASCPQSTEVLASPDEEGRSNTEKLYSKWVELQVSVNAIVDRDLDISLNQKKYHGVRQVRNPPPPWFV